jgi:hypothetical protein
MRPMQQCAAAEVWLGSGGCLRVTAWDIGTALTSRLGCVQPTESCMRRLETSH